MNDGRVAAVSVRLPLTLVGVVEIEHLRFGGQIKGDGDRTKVLASPPHGLGGKGGSCGRICGLVEGTSASSQLIQTHWDCKNRNEHDPKRPRKPTPHHE